MVSEACKNTKGLLTVRQQPLFWLGAFDCIHHYLRDLPMKREL